MRPRREEVTVRIRGSDPAVEGARGDARHGIHDGEAPPVVTRLPSGGMS
jgi:hypothetical protein